MVNKLLIATSLVILSGCAGIVVEDTGGVCRVSGSAISGSAIGNDAPDPSLCLEYQYKSPTCSVKVRSNSCSDEEL